MPSFDHPALNELLLAAEHPEILALLDQDGQAALKLLRAALRPAPADSIAGRADRIRFIYLDLAEARIAKTAGASLPAGDPVQRAQKAVEAFDELLNGPAPPDASPEAETCQHEPHEDCMHCVDCGKCREDLDSEDRCMGCGGVDENAAYQPPTLTPIDAASQEGA